MKWLVKKRKVEEPNTPWQEAVANRKTTIAVAGEEVIAAIKETERLNGFIHRMDVEGNSGYSLYVNWMKPQQEMKL